jgi:hypothetical protein
VIQNLLPHAVHPESEGWHPRLISWAQVIPLFCISGFRLTCVSGKCEFGFRSILMPNPRAAIVRHRRVNINNLRNMVSINFVIYKDTIKSAL